MRLRSLLLTGLALLFGVVSLSAETARETIARATLESSAARKIELVSSLSGQGDPAIKDLLIAWREDRLLLPTDASGKKTPVVLGTTKDASGTFEALRVDTGEPFLDGAGAPIRLKPSEVEAASHNSQLRRAMKSVLDLVDLADPNPLKRAQAVQTLGFSQQVDKLPILQALLEKEQNGKVKTVLREAIALIRLKSPEKTEKLAALAELREIHTLASTDFLRTAQREFEAAQDAELTEAARTAVLAVERHRSAVNFWGTLFRGLSNGSILLVVALGLAITFGLMRVINMAHGEMIAVGAYTTYIVQNIFGSGLAVSPFGLSISIPGMHATGAWYQSYFLFAIPLSFITAAGVGILLERSVIQFLYRRPLESLLATWGVSLVLQQLFRLIFGANNVQVSSPSYLSGNWTFFDIIFGWNRLFVIGFAIVIVIGTWAMLTKTPLGLLIRAVMQNRNMASCMGVRTERVNMLTFGLGSGLAGLAGAFLSQIGNVGPSLGQSYIVDSFMTVVVGGVGNLMGTIISAIGIGMVDQSLQQILLNPVLGKILVLAGIILFLQWRPAGIFVTRSRSLDD